MAKENVQKFFAEVAKNEDLQKQVKEISEKSMNEVKTVIKAQAESMAALAKKAGFDFTAEELLATSQQASGDKKLDADELDAVAGGASTSGGGACFIFGFGVGAAAGRTEGGSAVMACWGFGVGAGIWGSND